MLRASSTATGQEVDLDPIVQGSNTGDSGVAHGDLLLEFAEACVRHQATSTAQLRDRIALELGPEELVDAAAIVGNFQRMTRIADSTGIPLDSMVLTLSEEFRTDLGVEEFRSSLNTPSPSFAVRIFGPVMRKLAWARIRRMSASQSRR